MRCGAPEDGPEDELSNTNAVRVADNCVSALVVDLADMTCFEASALDLTEKGCWIVSDKVDRIREDVGLRLEGRDKLVRGKVIAYGDNEARISFEAGKTEPSEKRREIRRPVWIHSVVCGTTNPVTMKCHIVDASRSGCRLEGQNLDRLPQEIEISIPGLDLPIAARIVWRLNGQAGVQMNWPFEPEPDVTLEAVVAKLDREQQREAAKPKRKKRISAFGT